MDVMALIGAFGGGVIGAYMGAIPAFVMTGVFALTGALLTAAGAPADIAVNNMAFGSFLGPHVAFAGGVAAAAYAGKKKKLDSGADILSSLNGLAAPDVLLVGGLFGVLGFLLHFVISLIPWFGTATDLPGTAVFISALIARFAFGSSGLTGKYTGSEPRQWFTHGKGMGYNIMLGAGIGIAVSFVAGSLYDAGNTAALSVFPIACFGFSAITLVFTQMGFAMPATHHITLISGLAAVAGLTAFGAPGALLGALFGIIASLVGDWAGKTLNSHVDTHIDPPATTIWILTVVVSIVKIPLGL